VKEHLGNMLFAVTIVLKYCSRKGPSSRVRGWQMNSASIATVLNLQVLLAFSNYLILISYLC